MTEDILESTPKPKRDTIVTSNQYLRQGEFDKVVDYFMNKKNIDEQCMADLMFTWILANGRWAGKESNIVSSKGKIPTK